MVYNAFGVKIAVPNTPKGNAVNDLLNSEIHENGWDFGPEGATDNSQG